MKSMFTSKMARIVNGNNSLLLLMIVTTLSIVSCQGDEDMVIPVEASYPDAAKLAETYKTHLLSSPQGWDAELTPRLGKVYHLFVNVVDGSNISILADVDTVAAKMVTTTGYRIEVKNNHPTLIFDGGSNLDRIPGLDKNEGVDKEYTIKSNSENEIYLKGNLYGDELILVKSSQEIRQGFEEGRIKSTMKEVIAYLPTVRLLYFEPAPGIKIQFIVRANLRSTYFTYVENEKAKFFGSDYSYTFDGLKLRNSATIHGVSVGTLSFDATENKFFVMHQGQRLYANNSLIPVIPLHYLLGNEFSSGITMIAPWLSAQPGWSYKFLERWTLTDYDLDEFEYGLSLLYYIIDLNMDNNTMVLHVYTLNLYSRAAVADYPYSFTKSPDGVFDFTPLPINTSTTQGAYAEKLKQPLERMRKIIEDHTYRVEFYDYDGTFMPQYQSQQDSEVYFTGGFY